MNARQVEKRRMLYLRCVAATPEHDEHDEHTLSAVLPTRHEGTPCSAADPEIRPAETRAPRITPRG